ncbi:RNA-dependent RNA polymerase 1 [Spatholobus suberectus]|nr:RNA-dependent RNA polymerase 1 [Spatholobus suberectus]
MGKTIKLYGFPTSVTVSDVKTFVEQCTGEETVFAIKLRHDNKNGRAFAIIQFTAANYAASMMSLANNVLRLWYGSSYLKAQEKEEDIIVPKPINFSHSLGDVKLYFGCQISKRRFSVLWKKRDVSVNFGTGMRKIHFLFFHDHVQYKLELSYDNIWKIVLH